MSASFYDLLKFAKTGIASPEMTHYDKLKALAMCKAGFPVKTLTGIPPISFQSDGTPLTAWSISGAMTQSSVPTPSAPITPEETGDKTAQLWDEITHAGYITSDGSTFRTNGGTCAIIPCKPNTTYSVNIASVKNYNRLYISTCDAMPENYSSVTTLKSGAGGLTAFTVTTGADAAYLIVYLYSSLGADISGLMVSEGSTALPYEPFGYKLPLTLAGQTQTVYLSEPLRKIGDYADKIEASGTTGTRRIVCHVFDGTETGLYKNDNSAPTNYMYYLNVAVSPWKQAPANSSVFCTHLKLVGNAYSSVGITGTSNGRVFYMNFGVDIMNAQTSGNTVEGLKEYLAAQYAAGHPVTVWYVLATPTTETVTVPTLTPAKGSNTLTVGTTLQPSEVSITGGIK